MLQQELVTNDLLAASGIPRGFPEPAGNLGVASEKAPLLGRFPEKNL